MKKKKRRIGYTLNDRGWILVLTIPALIVHSVVALLLWIVTGYPSIGFIYEVSALAWAAIMVSIAIDGGLSTDDVQVRSWEVALFHIMPVIVITGVTIVEWYERIDWSAFVTPRELPHNANDDYFAGDNQ